MDNPCKGCIVTSMCKDPCQKFRLYVKYKLSQREGGAPYGKLVIQRLSEDLRDGTIVLDGTEPWGYRHNYER